MRIRALVAVLAGLAVTVAPAGTATRPLSPPTGLRGFILRADETPTTTFARTPSFAWNPYPGARSYDFQLATSKSFDETSLVWSSDELDQPLRAPVVSLPLALPWMSGIPFALYAHVRVHTAKGVSTWSE